MSSTLSESELRRRAEEWWVSDPDPETRDELRSMLDSARTRDAERLRGCFSMPLQFGTAGLRGDLGVGPAHFNVALVARLAAALDGWLTQNELSGPVVVGFDARHKSEQAALAAAGVLAACGRDVWVVPRPLPTPFLAFAARHLGAVAGLMVTASHNPRTDNGVKVFGPDARQIIAPADTEIAALLAEVTTLPVAASAISTIDESVWHAYVESCAALARSDKARRSAVSIVYTPVHGVGLETFSAVCDQAGFSFSAVPEQMDPDPDFPTAAFPNPEEPGVLDLALAQAENEQAQLVIANDPDADRLAAIVRDSSGQYRTLTGDELGCVLLWFLIRHRSLRGSVATTVVSSALPSLICADQGLVHHLTPTGFKWLSRQEDLGYAYEESIGYCIDPASVRDKDGISAGLVLADMLAEGVHPLEVLDELDDRYGAHVQNNFSLRLGDVTPENVFATTFGIEALADLPVVEATDLTRDPVVPISGVRLVLSDGDARVRVLVRPSGTEPKTKFYVEAWHDRRTEAGRLARAVGDHLTAIFTEHNRT